MSAAQAVDLIKTTFSEFGSHKGQWLAAAIAYYTAFAIAPLIVVIVEIASVFLGQHQSARNEIFSYLQHSAGTGSASAVRAMVDAALHQRRAGMLAQLIGWILFIFAAVGLFSSLQDALNTIWNVTPKKTGIALMARRRGAAFVMIVLMALIVIGSLLINTLLTSAAAALATVFAFLPTLIKIIDFALSWAVLGLVFAVIYRVLPDCTVEWRDVRVGAAISALLFVVGQFLLGWYLGRAGIASSYGAFGSLVVFLVWVNYSAQIMLFGAQFTYVYARRRGSQIRGAITGEIPHPRRQPS